VNAREWHPFWLAIAGAPGAWALQLVAGYTLEEAACPSDRGAVVPGTIAITAAAGIVALAAGLTAVGAYRQRRGGTDELTLALAAVAVIASLVFVGAVVASGVAALALDPCRQG
jgi:hypothetical protein